MTDTLLLRKARGAFFTPPELSRFITDWAIRSPSDVVLEPSCGEASFLHPAGDRLKLLAPAQCELNLGQLAGIEIHAPSAEEAHRLLSEHGLSAQIKVADFFDVPVAPVYDAVVGNPPYIRYQQFTGAARAKGLQAAFAQGVRLTGLASSWAAFVVHASQFLKPGGRLGLVLPAELLSVSYAAEVRRFLLQRFASVRLVMFEELMFPGVLEDVVLLLAEGQGPAPHFEVYQARGTADLAAIDRSAWTGFTPEQDDKWTPALLPASALEVYRTLTKGTGFTPMLTWGETYLGAVTGNNRYFTLTTGEVKAWGLRKRELLPISPPGSRHLRGLTFSDKAWESLRKDGSACYLFYPDPDAVSDAARSYIASGRARGIQLAYKCQARKPWWRVPVVPQADLLLTYMDHDRPRLTTNHANVFHLNSLYGVTLRPPHRQLGRDLLPIASLNSVSLLGGEMVGRAYGGGLLKLEPTEADHLPLPSVSLLQSTERELRALRPQLASALRQGQLAEAIKLVDRILLSGQLGLSHAAVQALRDARELLFSRRIARGKSGRANP